MRAAFFFFTLWLAACQLDMKPSGDFVKVRSADPYLFRATTPQGVSISARVQDLGEHTDVIFWVDTLKQHLVNERGYVAVGAATNINSADGVAGRQLQFTHEENGKAYGYSIALFVSGKELTLVEAGGPKTEFEANALVIKSMIETANVR